MDDTTLEKLEVILKKHLDEDGNTITLLQDIQNEFGYLPEKAVLWIAEKTEIHPSKFYGVATFYAQFFMHPRGKNIVTACCGTVCHVKGSHRIISRIQDELKLKPGEDTSRDNLITLEKVSCIGACSIAPVVLFNQKVHGMMTPDKTARKLKTYKDKKSE